MISNCGHDENNRYSGGKAGDQTGTEWRVINWYNRPWKCVLRHPDAKVRKMIASMAKAAAVNNKIGYDQSERYTFWEHLKASNYDPAQITIACEADCSSGVAAIVKGAGYRLGNEKMKNVSIYLYTGNMRAGLKAAGFEVLTDSKYLTSDAYLLFSFLCFEQIPKKIANATDTPESNREISIVNGVLLSELCRLDVVGVAVFPHVVFENIHLPVCFLYLLPEFRSDRLLDFRLFNDCLLLFHDCG